MVNYVTLKSMKEVLPYEVPPSAALLFVSGFQQRHAQPEEGHDDDGGEAEEHGAEEADHADRKSVV